MFCKIPPQLPNPCLGKLKSWVSCQGCAAVLDSSFYYTARLFLSITNLTRWLPSSPKPSLMPTAHRVKSKVTTLLKPATILSFSYFPTFSTQTSQHEFLIHLSSRSCLFPPSLMQLPRPGTAFPPVLCTNPTALSWPLCISPVRILSCTHTVHPVFHRLLLFSDISCSNRDTWKARASLTPFLAPTQPFGHASWFPRRTGWLQIPAESTV